MKRFLLTLLAVMTALTGLAPAAHAQTPSPSIEYYHLDALGSVRAVTDYAGVVVRRHEVLPFGEEWTEDGTPGPDEARLFTGKERDTETGLDYFGARYYRADVGRFTTIDPIITLTENLTDPQRWNRYAYVRNNPLKYIDPDGRETNPVTGASGISDSQIRREANSTRVGFYESPRPANDPPVHNGVDIAADIGTPLFAPISGEVTRGYSSYGGYYLRITRVENGHSVAVHMSHLREMPALANGSQVLEGEPLVALSGNTGQSAKRAQPHVHLSVWVDGKEAGNRRNPQKWFADHPSKNEWAARKGCEGKCQ